MIGSHTGEKNGLESALENAALNALQHNDLTAVSEARTYLDWLVQSIRPEDSYVQTEGAEFSTDNMWKTFSNENFQLDPTSFPQKSREWRVFFHSGLDATTVSGPSEVESGVSPVEQLWREAQSAEVAPDPLAPVPEYAHLPLKLGVTALVRAVEEEASYRQLSEEDGWESPAEKRTPLITQRPKLMSSLPKQPAFIAPLEENLGALRGTLTHKLLCLLPLDGLRRACMENKLPAYIKEEIHRMTGENVFSPEEAALIDLKKVEQFYLSPMGQRMLMSKRVRREWSFNLKITQPMETIVQGVIDLCFQENDGWILCDYKTDYYEDPDLLKERYASQLKLYAQALGAITGQPVHEIWLFGLRRGDAISIQKENTP
jgi:ATP-dependent exoDNAse (exonuclease V) beta subunit